MESTFRDTCPHDLRVIETFGAGPDGMLRWPAHRERLIATSARLGIVPDLEIVDAAVAVLDMSVPLRVRLTVDLDGGLNVEAVPVGRPPTEQTQAREARAGPFQNARPNGVPRGTYVARSLSGATAIARCLGVVAVMTGRYQ